MPVRSSAPLRSGVLRATALLAAVGLLVAAGAPAQTPSSPATTARLCAPAAPGTSPLVADASRTGVIDLYFFDARGAKVQFYECDGTTAHVLGSRSKVANGVLTPFYAATLWRCGQPSRYFAAQATLADGTVDRGTTSARTPTCASRFSLHAPAAVAGLGAKVTVQILDGWAIGGADPTLCFVAPSRRRWCQGVGFGVAVNAHERHFRPWQRGRWSVQLQIGRYVVRRPLAVGIRAAPTTAPPVLLATGDSTIGGVDNFLQDDLAGQATVVSREYPGFSVSLANAWLPIAVGQAATVHPAVTVVSLGGNEGFPMTTADGSTHGCCDAAWIAEYARRTRSAMTIYAQRGARVVYLTIVAPQEQSRVVVTDAVNTAIVEAAAGLPRVQVVRADKIFSPHGYQQDVVYRGRTVDVREPDGIHLNIAGTAIEAQAVVAALGRLGRG